MPAEIFYDEGQDKHYYAQQDQVRIFGLGIIDFVNQRIVFEDGTSDRITTRPLYLLDLFCRNPEGLSEDALNSLIKSGGSIRRDDYKVIRNLLHEKRPFRYLESLGDKKYRLNQGSPTFSHITIADIHKVLERRGLCRTPGSGTASLAAPPILDMIRVPSQNACIGSEVSEFVNGNGIHIKEQLDTLYSWAIQGSLSFLWDEQHKRLCETIKKEDGSAPSEKEIKDAITDFCGTHQELQALYFTADGQPLDLLARPYNTLTALCFIAMHDCSEFLSLFSGDEFAKLRSDFRETLKSKITEALTGTDPDYLYISSSPAVSHVACDTPREIEIPEPAACSNYAQGIVCNDVSGSADEGYTFSFDYGRVTIALIDTPWAMLFFHWDTGQDFSGKTLSFDYKFEDCNFSRIAVEVKKVNETICLHPAIILRKVDSSWMHYDFDFDCDTLTDDVRENVGEICFTVFATYADDKSEVLKTKGSFSVKNIVIR